jgi:hypothetical protein
MHSLHHILTATSLDAVLVDEYLIAFHSNPFLDAFRADTILLAFLTATSLDAVLHTSD